MKRVKQASLSVLLLNLLIGTAGADIIDLARTGQSMCYESYFGTEVSCTGSGQDGEFQRGVSWPSPRFTENGDNTITDNLTGLIWAKDANTLPDACDYRNYPGTQMDWEHALELVDCYNRINYLGYHDWRLPNVNELESLVHYGLNGSYYNAVWLMDQGFTNVVLNWYWTSTGLPSDVMVVGGCYSVDDGPPVCSSYRKYNYHYAVDMWIGVTQSVSNAGAVNVWPVRGVSNGSVTLARTGQQASHENGDDGYVQAGAAWPSPRFTDNGNDTVTDNLTGLMWFKYANDYYPFECNKYEYLDPSYFYDDALAHVECLNEVAYLGYTDWRLPNVRELRGLVDYSRYGPALSEGHPFEDVHIDDKYWTSTTDSHNPGNALTVEIATGEVYSTYKTTLQEKIWPVRGGTTRDACDSVLSDDLTVSIPELRYDGKYYQAECVFVPTLDGDYWWQLIFKSELSGGTCLSPATIWHTGDGYLLDIPVISYYDWSIWATMRFVPFPDKSNMFMLETAGFN